MIFSAADWESAMDLDQDGPYGDGLPPMIARTHDEALDLARRACGVIADPNAGARRSMSMEGHAVYAAETLRMSSRILHVIAWTLNRKAVAAGEISEKEAATPDRQLGGEDVCLADPVGDLDLLPKPIRSVIRSSDALYQRVLRLQDMMLADAQDDGAPSVHALWRRIEDYDA